MSTPRNTPEELRRQVDATRRELGATVEALAAKTAVRARLRERVKDDLKRPVLVAAIAGVAVVLVVGWTLAQPTN